jgi:hypothetical protein
MGELAQLMVDDWAATGAPPRHMAWLHEAEFSAH